MSRFRSGSRPRSRGQLTPPPSRPEELTVEKLAAGGSGFARRSTGEPVFVRGALPGDLVLVRELKARNGYSEAREWQLLRPSPDRRAAPCRYADRCGGCDVMALSPAAQRRVKHDMVVEILRRTAHVDATPEGPTPLTWVCGDEPDLGYRTRIRLHIDATGKLGFLAAQSHELVPIEACLVATERVNQVLASLVALSALRPELLRAFEQVEVRALGAAADLLWVPRTASHDDRSRRERPVAATSKRSRHPGAPSAEVRAARPDPARSLDSVLETIERHLHSEAPHLALHCAVTESAPMRWAEFAQSAPLGDATDAKLWFAPGTFTQVNWHVNQRIVAELVDTVRNLGATQFLDLYCGAGNFTLPLLAMGLRGVGVENNPTSIAVAMAAARAQQLGGTFIAAEVEAAVARLVAEQQRFDLILLDPPRAGFKEVVPKLAALAPKHLFICACDPVTFARDVRSLMAAGFELQRLTAYDMFPQTHHVECSAWLIHPSEHTSTHRVLSENSD